MKMKIYSIVISICLFLVGVFMLLWAETVTNLFSLIAGGFLIAYAILNYISYIKNNGNRLIIIPILVFLIVGIILVVRPSIINEIISFIAGIYFILTSIQRIMDSSELKSSKDENYNLSLGLGIAGIVIGILCVVGKILIPNLLLRFIGLMLVIYSIIDIINTILLKKESNKLIVKK